MSVCLRPAGCKKWRSWDVVCFRIFNTPGNQRVAPIDLLHSLAYLKGACHDPLAADVKNYARKRKLGRPIAINTAQHRKIQTCKCAEKEWLVNAVRQVNSNDTHCHCSGTTCRISPTDVGIQFARQSSIQPKWTEVLTSGTSCLNRAALSSVCRLVLCCLAVKIIIRGVRLAKNDFGSVLQKTTVFGSVSVLLN